MVWCGAIVAARSRGRAVWCGIEDDIVDYDEFEAGFETVNSGR